MWHNEASSLNSSKGFEIETLVGCFRRSPGFGFTKILQVRAHQYLKGGVLNTAPVAFHALRWLSQVENFRRLAALPNRAFSFSFLDVFFNGAAFLSVLALVGARVGPRYASASLLLGSEVDVMMLSPAVITAVKTSITWLRRNCKQIVDRKV